MMKKIISISGIALALLIPPSPGTCSRPGKGYLMVSPSFALTGKKIGTGSDRGMVNGDPLTVEKKNELLSFGFTPRIGYLFSDHLAAGMSIKYGKKITDGETDNIRLFTAGPFVRYLFTRQKVVPYIECECGAGHYAGFSSSLRVNGAAVYFASGGGGVEFFILREFSLDLGVNYKKTVEVPRNPPSEKNTTYENIGIRAGLSLYLNTKDLFRKKEKQPGF